MYMKLNNLMKEKDQYHLVHYIICKNENPNLKRNPLSLRALANFIENIIACNNVLGYKF